MSEQTMKSEAEVEAVEAAEAAADVVTKYTEQGLDALEGMDLAVPEAMRAAAEQLVAQSREAYERTKDAMEETVEMLEQSIDRAGQGAAAINRKVIDIAQTNLNSSFDLAKEMAGAKNVAELLQFQTTFARKQFETFAAQVEEFRTLSTQVATDAAEPVKAHVAKSMESLKTH